MQRMAHLQHYGPVFCEYGFEDFGPVRDVIVGEVRIQENYEALKIPMLNNVHGLRIRNNQLGFG